ncbi:cyclase family protein [Lysinimonas soli]|uniref:Cyclase family protein n=1 Tax=Lysinimonas soli TaxID=1074233 RepID=A0ABW0NR63_9MICO
MPDVPEYRAHLDARIEFANGGGLTAEGFRLDLPSADVDEDAVARLLVRHLGLALVDSVRIEKLRIVEEPHRGSRGVETRPTASGARRVVDLSHVIREGMVTYPGLPAPAFTPHLTREQSIGRYAPGTQFAMDIVTMIGNTGTYLDSPFHRYADGADLAGLVLETLVDLPAEVFHLGDVAPGGDGRRDIPASVFFDRELRGGAVLLDTGWSRLFGTADYGHGAPYLSAEAVGYLVEQRVALVGIDSLNIDDTESGGERPAHSGLLAAGIHVVEHLTNLASLPARGALFTAAPPAIEGFGTFPVRAYARM